jgi:hypothetical protein
MGRNYANAFRLYMPPTRALVDRRFRVEEQLDAEGDSLFVLTGEGAAVFSYSIWEIEAEIVRRGGDATWVVRHGMNGFGPEAD